MKILLNLLNLGEEFELKCGTVWISFMQ